MFDDINIKYKDAKIHINFINSIFIIRKLEKKVAAKNATAQDYYFLAKAYQNFIFTSKDNSVIVLKYLLKSIHADKNYAPAYNLLGGMYLDAEKPDKAEKCLLKAVEKGPDDYYPPLFWLGLIYTVGHNWEKAKQCMDKISEINSDEPLSYIAKFVLNSYACYSNHLDIKNYFKLLWSILKYRDFGSVASAIFILFRMIQIRFIDSLDIVNLRFLRIDYLNTTGRCEEILDNTLKFLKNFRLFRYYIYIELLGYYYWYAEDYKKCIFFANRFLIQDKIDLIYEYKALCYEDLGEYDKAVKALEDGKNSVQIRKTLIIRFLDKFLHYYIGDKSSIEEMKVRLYFKQGEYKKAIKNANEILIKNKNVYILRVKAISYYYLGKYEEALYAFHEALKYDYDGENRDNLCYWISYCYYTIANFNKARIYIDIALKEKEDYYNYYLKGNILSSLKNYKEADICYKKAYEYDEY